ncbi:MAG TPA: hypothetical protein VK420_01285 [Longimicrobium sp.]|nr:hypothetical protein [Longimicrobium sp.]
MSLRQILASAVFALSLCTAGCQPPDAADDTQAAAFAQGQEGLGGQLPVTRTSELDPAARLWPASQGRRYAVITRSLEDASVFVAYGVEVPANPSYDFAFIVAGSIDADLNAFLARVDGEGGTSVLFPSAPAGAGGAGEVSLLGGQIGNPPPTDPPGVTAYEIAVSVEEASL